jgi:hypothetical protein
LFTSLLSRCCPSFDPRTAKHPWLNVGVSGRCLSSCTCPLTLEQAPSLQNSAGRETSSVRQLVRRCFGALHPRAIDIYGSRYDAANGDGPAVCSHGGCTWRLRRCPLPTRQQQVKSLLWLPNHIARVPCVRPAKAKVRHVAEHVVALGDGTTFHPCH